MSRLFPSEEKEVGVPAATLMPGGRGSSAAAPPDRFARKTRVRPSSLTEYVTLSPPGEKWPARASHSRLVTQLRALVETSRRPTFWYPPFAFEVTSSVRPSGDTEEIE